VKFFFFEKKRNNFSNGFIFCKISPQETPLDKFHPFNQIQIIIGYVLIVPITSPRTTLTQNTHTHKSKLNFTLKKTQFKNHYLLVEIYNIPPPTLIKY
jgi:hypothetical protein